MILWWWNFWCLFYKGTDFRLTRCGYPIIPVFMFSFTCLLLMFQTTACNVITPMLIFNQWLHLKCLNNDTVSSKRCNITRKSSTIDPESTHIFQAHHQAQYISGWNWCKWRGSHSRSYIFFYHDAMEIIPQVFPLLEIRSRWGTLMVLCSKKPREKY